MPEFNQGEEDHGTMRARNGITRRQAVKTVGAAAIGLVFASPIIQSIRTKSAFAGSGYEGYNGPYCRYFITQDLMVETGAGQLRYRAGEFVCCPCPEGDVQGCAAYDRVAITPGYHLKVGLDPESCVDCNDPSNGAMFFDCSKFFNRAIFDTCDWPTAAQVKSDPTVLAGVDAAWAASNPYDYDTRREVGFWIIQDCTNRDRRTLRCGPQITIDNRSTTGKFGRTDVGVNERAVGIFHTHPNPAMDEMGKEWNVGPSVELGDFIGIAELRENYPDMVALLVHHTGQPYVHIPEVKPRFDVPLPPRSAPVTY